MAKSTEINTDFKIRWLAVIECDMAREKAYVL